MNFPKKDKAWEFACPNCKASIFCTQASFFCDKCNLSWPIEYGIPRFSDVEVEWSVFEPEVAEKVTVLAEKTSWQNAIDLFSETLGKYTLEYISDESRADWHVFLPLNSEATVLDIGSGWGNLGLSLSRWCRQLYCCDVNMTNLRLLNARMRDNGVENVYSFQYNPNVFLRLPFTDNSIDVVILNGVLEWMGAVEIDVTPMRIQIEALKEIQRVIKPGGVLYIGIENRYSLSTLRGQRIHGELPFVGLFPRWFSNLVTKLVRGEPHRTYIYSLNGYKKITKSAGFEKTDVYLPYPNYHNPNYFIPLEPAWVRRFWFTELTVNRSKQYQLVKQLGLFWLPFHWLSYSFGIRCVK